MDNEIGVCSFNWKGQVDIRTNTKVKMLIQRGYGCSAGSLKNTLTFLSRVLAPSMSSRSGSSLIGTGGSDR